MSTTKKGYILIFAFLFTLFSLLSSFEGVYAQSEKLFINVGVRNINVTVSYSEGEDVTTEVFASDKEGKVYLDSLYAYMESLGWEEPDDTLVTELPLSFEVNHPGKTPQEKDESLNGDGHYTDNSGNIILTPENWRDEIDARISEISYSSGEVLKRDKNGSETAVESGYEVKIGPYTFTTDSEGKFDTYPQLKEEDAKDFEVSIKGDEEYNDYTEKYSDFAKEHKAVLLEREMASENDYSYGEGISDNGYVKVPGSYQIYGNNTQLALSPDEPFRDSVNVSVSDNGEVSKVYIKRSGEILKPVEDVIRLDQSAPTITGIDTIRETDGDMIKFLLHGIFTNEPADITLNVTVADEGSGVSKIHLIGENKETGEKVIYEPLTMKQSDDKYSVFFKVEGEDFKVLENLLKVVVVDKVGNESDLRLVRTSEAASTLVLEKIKPEISNIKDEGEKSGNGWFRSGVKVSFDAQDKESGLYNLRVTLNGADIYEKEFKDTRNVDINSLSFNITPEMVTKYMNASGSYEAFFTLTDNSGNVTTLNHKMNIDLVNPEVTLSGIETGKAYKVPPTLNIKNNEKHYTVEGSYVNISVIKDGQKFDEKKYKRQNDINYSNFETDGRYEITVYAVDAAGNKSSEKKVNFIKDTKKPIIKVNNISGSQNNGWYNKPITIAFDSQDNFSGLKSVKATVNGTTLFSQTYTAAETKNNTYSFNITKANIENLINSAGSYDIVFTSEDYAGNVENISRKLYIDIVAPNVKLSGINKTYYKNVPTLKVANDEKHYSKDGAYINVVISRDRKVISEKRYDKKNSLSINSFGQDGDYTITAYAVDAAGNKSKEKSVSFVKDSVKPSISNIIANGTKKNGWYKNPFAIDFNIKDDRSGLDILSVKLNDREVLSKKYDSRTTSAKKLSFNLTESYIKNLMNKSGKYTAVFTLGDKSGNTRKVTKVYKIDNVSPKVSISGIEKGRHYINSPTLSVVNNEKHYAENGAYIMVIAERDGKVVSREKYPSLSKTSFSDFKADGNYKLTVYAVDAAGNKSGEKVVSFVKDATKPVITINGVTEGKYYAADITGSISVNERYYKTNNVSISVKRTLNGKTYNVSFPWSNDGRHSAHSKTFSETGTYKVTVKAKDQAGNVAEKKSISFTVDTKRPEITISGVKNKAYGKSDSVSPIVTLKDDYFSSKKVTLTRNGEAIKMNPSFAKDAFGGKFTFNDFPKEEKYDGVYTLTVSAVDKAGNTTKKTVTFSINRFGSTFKYNKAINKLIAAKYVQRVPSDLVITEYNITKTGNVSGAVKHDGIISKITPATETSRNNSYRMYTHKFKALDFENEGIYSINIVSKDKLGNIAESQKKTGKINFAVDRTAPLVILDKDIGNASFDVEVLPVKAKIIDSISPASVEVVLNGEQVDSKKFNKNAGEVDFVVPEGRNNSVKIIARDLAGNEKTYKYSHVTVSTNWLVRLTGNKVLYTGIGVFLAALGTSIFIVRRKKRS